jgi:flagellar basal body-associated protein FliL
MQFLSQKSGLKKSIKNHGKKILKVLILLTVIAIGFLIFWFASTVILNTEYPIVPVSSSNMCVFQLNCDGLEHPFERTLNVGDLVMVQGVNAVSVGVAYPNSDILVFHSPKQNSYQEDELVITRVIAKEERNGITYFRTKGDGQGFHKWPEIPNASECDIWYDYRENYTLNRMISEKLLVGKVVFRIPWVGYIALFMQNFSGILIIVVLILIILIVQFVVPIFTSKKAETEPKKSVENPSET